MRFKVTPEEWARLMKLSTEARDTPVILLGGSYDMGGAAHNRVQQEWNRLGKKYGFLPLTLRNPDEKDGSFDADPIEAKP